MANISYARYDFGFSNKVSAENMVNNHMNEKSSNNNAYYDDYKKNPTSYNVNNLQSDAREKEIDDKNSKLLKKSYETNNLKFRGDESFLSQNNDIMINNKSTFNLQYSSCKDLEFDCFDYKKSINISCLSNLANKNYGNHFFTCNEQKNIFSDFCLEENQFICKKSIYTLPDTTHMSFPNYYFRNNRLGYITPNRMHQNCSGYNYYWRFNLDSLDNMEELKFIWGRADDRTLIYVNNNLVHNYPHYGCEFYRAFHNAPNKDLKPYLKIGSNEIRVRIIVGGKGEARGEFQVRYQKCQEFNQITSNNCQSLELNPNCKKQGSKFCYKTDDNYYILGKKVDECLEYKQNYNCVDEEFNHNKCDLFKSDTQCAIHSSSCNNYNQEFNKCTDRTSKFECDYKKEFDNYNNIDYEFTYDVNLLNYDESDCQNYKNDLNSCKLSDKKCLLTDQNNICHKYQNNYQCQNNPNSKCNILSKECNFLRSKCSQFDNQDKCLIENKYYFCPNKIDNINSDNNDILMCDMSDYITSNQDPEEENDFGKSVSHMKMLEEAGDDFINNPLSIFTGQSNSCNQDKLSYNNCCKAGGWGNDIGLGGCSYEEEKLQLQSKNKQCIYVGSHCSKKVLGKCIRNQHSYCCFNSKIAKLIQEQGKSQLGKSFGSSNSPNCAGLTESDIVNIDFSKMDFSEITNDIISKTKPHDPDNFNKLAKEKIEEFFDKHKN